MKIGKTDLYKRLSSQREFHEIQLSDNDALQNGANKFLSALPIFLVRMG
jgi:hypothetical protein